MPLSPSPRSAPRSRSAFHRDRISPVSFALRILIFHVVSVGVETEGLEALHHMRRQRRAHVEDLAGAQRQPYAPRVQQQPFPQSRRTLKILDIEVARIAHDRV